MSCIDLRRAKVVVEPPITVRNLASKFGAAFQWIQILGYITGHMHNGLRVLRFQKDFHECIICFVFFSSLG